MKKCLSYICCCFRTKPKTKSKRYKRQSFDERICNDLSEVVLQYLTLEDKIRLECVSNQFQRTIFKKQFDLNITSVSKMRKNQLKSLISDLIAFESILKKCPNIRSINFSPFDYRLNWGFDIEVTKIISLLNKYCHHLNRFDFRDFKLEGKNGKEFIDKFGPQLISIADFDCIDQNLLISFPNINELSLNCFLYPIPILQEIRFKNLKKINIHLANNLIDDINQFLERHKGLKYLDLKITPWVYSNDCFKDTLNQISKLKHLNHIGINTRFVVYKQLRNSWKSFFLNCTQIKSLKIDFWIEGNDSLKLREFIEHLKEIKRLKRLEINLIYKTYYSINRKNLFTLQDLKKIANISHLILNFICFYHFSLKENFLTEIDKTLPNVQYLEINKEFKTKKGSTQMADILSRLSRLETLKLKVNNDFICNQIKSKVIEKCRKIQTICLEVI